MEQTYGEFEMEVHFNWNPENSGDIYLKSRLMENYHMYQIAHLLDVKMEENSTDYNFHYKFETKEQLDRVLKFYEKNHERLFEESYQGELAIERIQDELDKNIKKWVKETESDLHE